MELRKKRQNFLVAGFRAAGTLLPHRAALSTWFVLAAPLPPTAPVSVPRLDLSGLSLPANGDATAALQSAINGASGRCLDGGGRAYIITGSLRAAGSICLHNMRIIQRGTAVNTRAYIREPCDAGDDASVQMNCHDRVPTGRAASDLVDYVGRRTLFVSPGASQGSVSVTLVNVSIDRGDDPSSGSRSDAAALWIDGAHHVRLIDVEITGAGKGHGLLISNSRNVEIRRLHVHDMVWAPYSGDTPLTLAAVRTRGWNRPTVREILPVGHAKVRLVGVRVQEQLSCVTIVNTQGVVLRDTRIDNCGARFAEGNFPWQADGIGLSEGTADVQILGETRVTNTWEGIDVVGSGTGVRNVVIDGAYISDSFSVGIKVGHRVSNLKVRNTTVDGAGLTGIMMYGPVSGAVMQNIKVDGIGDDPRDSAAHRIWGGDKAGMTIDRDGHGLMPRAVTIDNFRVHGGDGCAAGILQRTSIAPAVGALKVTGCPVPLRRR